VHLVESESSVDALVKAGRYATTWAGGAGAVPLAKLADVFGDGRGVVYIADSDEPGIRCAESIRAVLPDALYLRPPTAGQDVRDTLPQDPRLQSLALLP
jgi:hypothetical protein